MTAPISNEPTTTRLHHYAGRYSALSFVEPTTNKRLGKCVGVYAFYDFDGEPIYVGQTTEDFGTRIGRHLRGQRSDAARVR